MCRVFKKNKNLKLKMQERALSYEEQMGLLPEPIGSPEILSGRFAISDRSKLTPTGSVKREIINLDEYNSPGSDHHHHHQTYVNYAFQREQLGPNMSSPEQMRSYLTRSLSLKRPEVDVHHFYMGPTSTYDQDVLGDFNDATTSGSDGDYNNDVDSAISGLENVDWSALLQEPVTSTGVATTATKTDPGSDVTVLLQLKRQNSDIFSSLDLWNYSQIAQHM